MIPDVDEHLVVQLLNDPTSTVRELHLGAACASTTDSPHLTGKVPDAEALALCAGCPVRHECLASALHYEARDGVRDEDRFGWWGGASPGERASFARRIGIAQPVVEFEDPASRARRLRTEGHTISSIASELGCAERTVYRYIAGMAA